MVNLCPMSPVKLMSILKKINRAGIFNYFRIDDPSTQSLIFSNLLTIFFAVKENWDLPTVMWIYWFQSLTIGLFNFIKILTLKNFSTEGFYIGKKPVPATESTKISTAFFFLIHYNIFHLVYFIFIFGMSGLSAAADKPIQLKYIIVSSAVFFFNHFFSFLYNRYRDGERKRNISDVMFSPYARIFPMHLTIFAGHFLNVLVAVPIAIITAAGMVFPSIQTLSGHLSTDLIGRIGEVLSSAMLIFFLALKTAADVVMHTIEHAEGSERAG